MHAKEQEMHANLLTYFMARRDQAIEKVRFGLVALNGASIVALISTLGGNGDVAKWFGFTPVITVYSAISFAIGAVLAGHSLNAQTNDYTLETGDAWARWSKLNTLLSLYANEADKQAIDQYSVALSEYHNLELVGFQGGKQARWAQHFAAGAWMNGILAPLSNAMWPHLQNWATSIIAVLKNYIS